MSALIVTTRGGDSGWHQYSLNGQRVPGVTSCTGVLDKPALVAAARKLAAQWAASNPEQLTALGHEQFVEMAAKASSRVWGAKSKIGRTLHEHAEKLATTGEAPDVSPSDMLLVQQAADFLDAMQVETIAAERCVFHEGFMYAGRLDLLASIHGRVWLLDFKTGSGVYPEHVLQAAAYRYASHMQGSNPAADDVPMVPVSSCGIVHVRPDGWQLIPVKADNETWQAFLATIPLYHFIRQAREAIIGAPAAAGRAEHVSDVSPS